MVHKYAPADTKTVVRDPGNGDRWVRDHLPPLSFLFTIDYRTLTDVIEKMET